MDYDDSRWTKRRRVKMKVQEHLKFLEDCHNDEDIVPTNMDFIASEEELASHGNNNSNDRQICGHHSEELGSQSDEESHSEVVSKHSFEATMIRLIRKAQLTNPTLVALVTLQGNWETGQ